MKSTIQILTALAVLACGCQPSSEANPTTGSDADSVRNNSYSLLYQLLNEERHLSKLLIIKHESKEVRQLINQIAAAAEEAAEHVEEIAKQDSSINLEAENLPAGERAVRESIAASKRKVLLGEKGETFEQALLLTQLEALNYASHLAEIAATSERESQRSNYLSKLSLTLEQLHSGVLQLLFRRQVGAD